MDSAERKRQSRKRIKQNPEKWKQILEKEKDRSRKRREKPKSNFFSSSQLLNIILYLIIFSVIIDLICKVTTTNSKYFESQLIYYSLLRSSVVYLRISS